MGKKIAMGFHTCVDYELIWDTAVVEEQIRAFDIHAADLKVYHEVASERELWIGCLALMQDGVGGEMMPRDGQVCHEFANRFHYEITLGGTSTRAAIVLDKMGYESALQTSCYNRYVKQLMPPRLEVLPGVPELQEEIYPHVALQYQGGVRIRANDIDFVTPRENRILITSDLYSLFIPVLDEEFGAMLGDCQVFLMGCFSEILDREILEDRVEKTRRLFDRLPKDAVVVMEDGCYVKKDFRYYVHGKLCPHAQILSMNEDELQEYIGRRIDLLDPEAVQEALDMVRQSAGIPTVLVHSALWAVAYGDNARSMREALEGGVAMAGTRFRIGDDITPALYEETAGMAPQAAAADFCRAMESALGERICCVPCKDLSHVEKPTVVGLGDSFVGGLLPGLLKENRI